MLIVYAWCLYLAKDTLKPNMYKFDDSHQVTVFPFEEIIFCSCNKEWWIDNNCQHVRFVKNLFSSGV